MTTQSQIARLEKKVIMLDNTIVMLRRPAWGNTTRLRECLKQREAYLSKLREMARDI